MMRVKKLGWIGSISFALLSSSAFSATPTFDNITAADYAKIVKEMSANFTYSTVTPASSLGHLWGFEIGAVGGLTKTPEILNIVKRADPNTKLKDKFPHAGAIARLTVPFGITAEALIFPKITVSDLSIKQFGGAAMWTITDLFLTELPVTLGTKVFFNKAQFSYSQTINNASTGNVPVAANISYDNTVFGLQAMVSKKLLVFEPYINFGWVKSKGDLGISAAVPATIFSTSFTTGNSATSKPSSVLIAGGVDVQLLFFSLGAEYLRSFGKNSFTGRLSFRF
ncbi:MAG: hypothetical protein M9962_07370 [Oligoflexia bacterium]|nr:hypothetical protein [Oligoflexia bacterium]